MSTLTAQLVSINEILDPATCEELIVWALASGHYPGASENDQWGFDTVEIRRDGEHAGGFLVPSCERPEPYDELLARNGFASAEWIPGAL